MPGSDRVILDPLMTVCELAGYLTLSKSMVYKLVDEGKLPHIRIGKSLRFRRAEIEEWLDSQRVEPKPLESPNAEFERDVDKILSSTIIRAKL